MHPETDPVGDFDLAAYVDDQLSVARRIEVEAFLAARPEAAARVMAELRTRDELRVALSAMPLATSVRTNDLARKAARSFGRRIILRRFSRAAVFALMIAAGWVAHAEFNALGVRESVASAPPPAFVADAVRAHGTSAIRAAMKSQVETAEYDPAEILAATAIRVPELPAAWTVQDVQIFPSTFGPSVEMVLGSPDLGNVSLFAVRPGTFDVVPVDTFVDGSVTAIHWQTGEVAYALVTIGGSRDALEREALRIETSLR